MDNIEDKYIAPNTYRKWGVFTIDSDGVTHLVESFWHLDRIAALKRMAELAKTNGKDKVLVQEIIVLG